MRVKIARMCTTANTAAPALQSGAALVTSLLLLIVLTVIGVTVMQVSRTQERMVGNARDLNTAFEAAEAALRNGEAQVRNWTAQPATCSTAPCLSWATGTFSATGVGDVASLGWSWWQENAMSFSDGAGATSMSGISDDPRYVIEDLAFVRTDGGVELGGEPPPGREFYQISAYSTGASGQANVLLQSTYARKF